MADLRPTRITLFALRRKLYYTNAGMKLLKSKREGLLKEMLDSARKAVTLRERLDEALRKSMRELVMGRSIDEERMNSAGLPAGGSLKINITAKKIWGVAIPEMDEFNFKRSVEARGFSPVGESLLTVSLADSFEDVLALILKTAKMESMVKRIAKEVKSTTRRINAIEHIIIPKTSFAIKKIEASLEEREREERFRLKRFKNRRESY